MSNIDKRALRDLATALDGDDWHAEGNSVYGGAYDVGDDVCYDHIASCESVNGESHLADFIAAANPATVLALLDELEASERRSTELTEALRQSVIGYKSCLRMGYERILDLGGDCDSPEMMIAGNPDIQQAEKLLAAAAGKGE